MYNRIQKSFLILGLCVSLGSTTQVHALDGSDGLAVGSEASLFSTQTRAGAAIVLTAIAVGVVIGVGMYSYEEHKEKDPNYRVIKLVINGETRSFTKAEHKDILKHLDSELEMWTLLAEGEGRSSNVVASISETTGIQADRVYELLADIKRVSDEERSSGDWQDTDVLSVRPGKFEIDFERLTQAEAKMVNNYLGLRLIRVESTASKYGKKALKGFGKGVWGAITEKDAAN